jgi:hypothetical protein
MLFISLHTLKSDVDHVGIKQRLTDLNTDGTDNANLIALQGS